MATNLNSIDRVIRLLLAAAAVFLYYNGTLSGTWGIVAIVVAVVFALTSLFSFCPIYRLLGISTFSASSSKK